MDFSLDWFLSIPGLLISGGVLLFIIALILLIATMAKKKKEKKTTDALPAAETSINSSTASAPDTATPAPAAGTSSPVPEMTSPSVTGGTITDIPTPTVGPTPEGMNTGVNAPTGVQATPANVAPAQPVMPATMDTMAQPQPVARQRQQ